MIIKSGFNWFICIFFIFKSDFLFICVFGKEAKKNIYIKKKRKIGLLKKVGLPSCRSKRIWWFDVRWITYLFNSFYFSKLLGNSMNDLHVTTQQRKLFKFFNGSFWKLSFFIISWKFSLFEKLLNFLFFFHKQNWSWNTLI